MREVRIVRCEAGGREADVSQVAIILVFCSTCAILHGNSKDSGTYQA